MSRDRRGHPWFSIVVPQPHAHVRLICVPYAGGGASVFVPWARALAGTDIEVCAVQLPGRENRVAEAPMADMNALVRALADATVPLLDKPYALFGHSMGATVAFELAHELRARTMPGATHFFASGALAPDVPEDDPPLHGIPGDDAFVFAVAERFGGVPQAVLDHAELRELIAPALRADLTIHETYACAPRLPLDVDLTAYGGTRDPKVHEAGLRRWAAHTSRAFAARLFEGDHFFVQSARDAVLADIRATLRA